jgi:membrane AbrB-like protein
MTNKWSFGSLPTTVQWLVLIAASLGVAALLLSVHAPAALLLGPLLASMALSTAGAKLRLPLTPFVFAQGMVGSMIAKMVPISIVGDVVSHWVLFSVGVLSVVAVSTLLGWIMTRLQVLPGTTALWGTSPGAASVMTLMAEAYGADPRLVAIMQYLRVLMVAAVAAIVARTFGITPEHKAAAIVWFPPIAWIPFAETVALAIAGPIIAQRLNIPAGAFLVPLVVGGVLSHFGLIEIEQPLWLMAACYTMVGWNIGLRFTRPLLVHAAKALPRILICIFIMIGLCGCVAAMLVVVAKVDPLTAYLATSPGGADSVAIIAASSNVDVSFVMAMQTVRLIAVLLLAPMLTKFIVERMKLPPITENKL